MPISKWEVIPYENADGDCPVRDFLKTLRAKDQVRVLDKFRFLEQHGPFLSEEHQKKIAEGLWELRISIQDGIVRFPFFTLSGRIIILTHGFSKKTQKTPRREIDRALEIRGEYLTRRR